MIRTSTTRSFKILGVGTVAILGMTVLMRRKRKGTNKHLETVLPGDDTKNDNLMEDPLSDMTLKNVQIFFRHGARVPVQPIPFLDDVSIAILFAFG